MFKYNVLNDNIQTEQGNANFDQNLVVKNVVTMATRFSVLT